MSTLLLFVLIHVRHVMFGAGLALLMAGAARFFREKGNRDLACGIAASGIFFMLASAPFAFGVSRADLSAVFMFGLALSAACGFCPKPEARLLPAFSAFAAAALISGLLILAFTGKTLPLLFAETASLFSAVLYCRTLYEEKRQKEKASAEEKDRQINAVQTEKEKTEQLLQQKTSELSALRAETESGIKAAVQAERDRYIQDMHDGLGAELTSALAAAKNGALSQKEMIAALQACLDEMRIAIDAGGVSGEDITAAMANLRYRLEPRLKAAGFALRWNILGMPDEFPLSPDRAQCVLRVLQESLTNALKYSGGTEIRVKASAGETDAVMRLEVSDNGRGFCRDAAPSSNGSGLGLLGMKKRVEACGGTLGVVSEEGKGVTVTLSLPQN